MTTIHEVIEVQDGKLPGLLGTVFGWLRDVLAWLKTERARVWLRLAAVAWMIAGGRAARGGADPRAPVVSHR